MSAKNPIIVSAKPIPKPQVLALLGNPFATMIKFVVDIDRSMIALGGSMHVDAEAELLEAESSQESLWGGNYYPGRKLEECIEYTSMINIRPAQQNTSMEVMDTGRRARIQKIVFALVGRGASSP